MPPLQDITTEKTEEEIAKGLEEDLKPKQEEPVQKGESAKVKEESVPFHEDPKVQLYIEQQVAKRVGEGNKAWEDRIEKLEARLAQGARTNTPTKIGDWTPSTPAEERAARAIIQAAKQEVVNDFTQKDAQERERQRQEDESFNDWLKELDVTGQVAKEKQKEFVQLIVDYGVTDQEKALNLWKRLQQQVTTAREEGEIEGIKRSQEAKIGSARKGNEPGATGRSYQQRRAEEPNFDTIRDREHSRFDI